MKKVVKYVSEISLAMVLIFISYFAWDRIDVEAYEKYITQYTTEDIDVSVDNSFSELVYESVDDIRLSVLNVNNYQNKKYNANILLELNDVNEQIVNNLILVVDNNKYSLKDIISYKDTNKYCFLIANVDLSEYEKKSYNIKLLVDDNYEFNESLSFSYNIIEEIV